MADARDFCAEESANKLAFKKARQLGISTLTTIHQVRTPDETETPNGGTEGGFQCKCGLRNMDFRMMRGP